VIVGKIVVGVKKIGVGVRKIGVGDWKIGVEVGSGEMNGVAEGITVGCAVGVAGAVAVIAGVGALGTGVGVPTPGGGGVGGGVPLVGVGGIGIGVGVAPPGVGVKIGGEVTVTVPTGFVTLLDSFAHPSATAIIAASRMKILRIPRRILGLRFSLNETKQVPNRLQDETH
jgi:hypothetical protein